MYLFLFTSRSNYLKMVISEPGEYSGIVSIIDRNMDQAREQLPSHVDWVYLNSMRIF